MAGNHSVAKSNPPPEEKPPISPDLLTSALFIGLLAVFVLSKLPGLKPNVSDENIYFYMATAILRGSLPYRDFFYANPPGLLVILSLAAALTQSAFFAFKTVPLLAAMVSGLALFLILHDRWPRWPALFGTFAFLFSYDHLRASSHCTGVGVTLSLILLSLFLTQRRYCILGGVLLALACMVKTFGLVAVPALLVMAILRGGRRSFLEAVISFLSVFILSNALCLLFFGENFWKQTVLYHLAKIRRDDEKWLTFARVLGRNAPLTALSLAGALIMISNILMERTGKRIARLKNISLEVAAIVFLVSLALFMILQKRVYDFYLVLGFPAAAILSTSTLLALFEWPALRKEPLKQYRLGVIAIILILLFAFPISPAKFGSRLWGWAPGYKAYLDHEAKYFEKSGIMARYLQERMLLADTLAGDSGTVPLVAVLGHLRIAGDEADTNSMRFSSRTTLMSDYLKKIGSPRYVILRSRAGGRSYDGIGSIQEFRDWIATHYKPVTRWTDVKDIYYLFERANGVPVESQP